MTDSFGNNIFIIYLELIPRRPPLGPVLQSPALLHVNDQVPGDTAPLLVQSYPVVYVVVLHKVVALYSLST